MDRSQEEPNTADVGGQQMAVIEAFVIRARRIAAHSLASDPQVLLDLSRGKFTATPEPDGMVRIRSKFPPEEQLESLAARVRPVMLDRDPVYLPKVLGALAYFLRGVPEHEQACRRLKQRWQEVDPRGGKLAGYRVEQGHTDGTGDISTASDSVLALAWLYGDVVHADTERRAAAGGISIEERYRSAAHAVARIAVLLLSALGFILHLRREGRLPLSDTVLKQAVVVISPDRDEVVRFWMAEVGTEMPAEGEPFGPGWGQVNLHSSPPEDPSASSDD